MGVAFWCLIWHRNHALADKSMVSKTWKIVGRYIRSQSASVGTEIENPVAR